jgi:hypothetical protein
VGTFTIIDAAGKWVTNPRAFSFSDPETGVRYAPGEVKKVACAPDSWLAVQMEAGVLVSAPDPTRPTITAKPAGKSAEG